MSAGDGIGFYGHGTTLDAYYKPVAGAWGSSPLFSVSDSAYSAAGNIGLGMAGVTVRGDDFGGGTVAPSSVMLPVWQRIRFNG
jgi:hypothetical protein